MKKFNEKVILVFVLIVIICFETNSQSIVNIKILPENPANQDTVELYSGVFFTFGAPSSCPPLSGCTIINEDSYLLLNLFFDISGPWFQFGCASCDTTEIGKLDAGNYLMRINVNTILDSDTNFLEDTDSLEFTVINSNDVYESEIINKIVIYPNPAKEYVEFDFKISKLKVGSEIRIMDVFGQDVARLPIKSEKTTWNCWNTEQGIYLYKIEINGQSITGKIVLK